MEFNSVNSSISDQNAYLVGRCQSAMNEKLLIAAARSGDKSAFNELYVRHSRKLLPMIYRITKNREDAEDALQEASLKAFLHFETYEGRSNFLTWLTRIAINSAFMVLRKRHTAEFSMEQMSRSEDGSRSWEPCDNAETPEARYARCETAALLVGAIQRLPWISREILKLKQSGKYSSAQIASKLGISVAAMKSRLMRARKSLRPISKVPIHCGLKSNSTSSSLGPRFRSRAAADRP